MIDYKRFFKPTKEKVFVCFAALVLIYAFLYFMNGVDCIISSCPIKLASTCAEDYNKFIPPLPECCNKECISLKNVFLFYFIWFIMPVLFTYFIHSTVTEVRKSIDKRYTI